MQVHRLQDSLAYEDLIAKNKGFTSRVSPHYVNH
jgi:hypothetical protein